MQRCFRKLAVFRQRVMPSERLVEKYPDRRQVAGRIARRDVPALGRSGSPSIAARGAAMN